MLHLRADPDNWQSFERVAAFIFRRNEWGCLFIIKNPAAFIYGEKQQGFF